MARLQDEDRRMTDADMLDKQSRTSKKGFYSNLKWTSALKSTHHNILTFRYSTKFVALRRILWHNLNNE
jgi:hypothetical protein